LKYEVVFVFVVGIAKAMSKRNGGKIVFQMPFQRTPQRKPSSALSLFDVAFAMPSKRRLDDDFLCGAETVQGF